MQMGLQATLTEAWRSVQVGKVESDSNAYVAVCCVEQHSGELVRIRGSTSNTGRPCDIARTRYRRSVYPVGVAIASKWVLTVCVMCSQGHSEDLPGLLERGRGWGLGLVQPLPAYLLSERKDADDNLTP
jgi:hypothetical protein